MLYSHVAMLHCSLQDEKGMWEVYAIQISSMFHADCREYI
jgi:hypothetical protein